MLALAAGLPFGVTGVAIAYTVATYVLFVPALAYAGRPLDIGARDVIRACGPQVLAGCVAGIGGFLIEHAFFESFAAFTRVVLSSAICITIYVSILVGVFRVTEPFAFALSLIRGLIGSLKKRLS